MEKQINTVLEAERILKFWIPWLSGDGIISADVVYLIAKGKLSAWLKGWQTQMGRRSELVLAECAEDLAKLTQSRGRVPPWRKIGEAIADGIPEAQAQGKSDYGNWIYKLVDRHRKQQRLLKQPQPLSRRLARRNTKHRFVPPNRVTLQQALADRQRQRKSRGKL